MMSQDRVRWKPYNNAPRKHNRGVMFSVRGSDHTVTGFARHDTLHPTVLEPDATPLLEPPPPNWSLWDKPLDVDLYARERRHLGHQLVLQRQISQFTVVPPFLIAQWWPPESTKLHRREIFLSEHKSQQRPQPGDITRWGDSGLDPYPIELSDSTWNGERSFSAPRGLGSRTSFTSTPHRLPSESERGTTSLNVTTFSPYIQAPDPGNM
ncbi:hypothetical protein B0H10DRAFT_2264621 [Mycena sp. CBHHK59/15]|nr:hypothetical protein B0H10DRAFT_2264621 [Mycena sp. CBHHK59/15]